MAPRANYCKASTSYHYHYHVDELKYQATSIHRQTTIATEAHNTISTSKLTTVRRSCMKPLELDSEVRRNATNDFQYIVGLEGLLDKSYRYLWLTMTATPCIAGSSEVDDNKKSGLLLTSSSLLHLRVIVVHIRSGRKLLLGLASNISPLRCHGLS